VPVGTASVIPLEPIDGPQNSRLAATAIYSFLGRTQKLRAQHLTKIVLILMFS
jgi:hypothetical protein